MIIAECCQNHNGNLEILRDMVFNAAEAGVDFVKIQSFFADDLADQSNVEELARLKKLELSWDDHVRFVDWCKQAGVLPMTSVYTSRDLNKLKEIGFDHIKIGSAQASNSQLIKDCLPRFQVLVSTGGQRLNELDWDVLAGVFSVLHCVSHYPALPNQANLWRINEIRNTLGFNKVGFSDHTDPALHGWELPSKIALFLGANVIERHFTILPRGKTKDGNVSLDFAQLSDLCKFAKLDLDGKREELGLWSMLRSKQDDFELVEKYKGRWKEV